MTDQDSTHSSSEVNTWLIAWFSQRGQIPCEDLDGQLGINYFEAKIIDSLGVIELIAEVESVFGIRFEETHFQDRRFATIGGLGELINELR